MKTIKHLLEVADTVIETRGFESILHRLHEIHALATKRLNEGFMDDHRGDLEKKFDDLERKVLVARRALGKVNSSRLDSDEQRTHKRIIMQHINSFRRDLHVVMKELGMEKEEMDYHLARIGMDREYGTPSEIFTRPSDDKKKEHMRDVINKKRNLASPDQVASYNKLKYRDKTKPYYWLK